MCIYPQTIDIFPYSPFLLGLCYLPFFDNLTFSLSFSWTREGGWGVTKCPVKYSSFLGFSFGVSTPLPCRIFCSFIYFCKRRRREGGVGEKQDNRTGPQLNSCSLFGGGEIVPRLVLRRCIRPFRHSRRGNRAFNSRKLSWGTAAAMGNAI